DASAGGAAGSRGQKSADAAAAHGGGGPGGGGLPRPARLSRKPGGRSRDSGSSAGAADHPGLPARSDGLPGSEPGARGDGCQELARAGRATALLREPRLWIATERVPLIEAAFADTRYEPAVVVPGRDRARTWTREDAVRELVRGRLEVVGPTTAEAIAAALGVP